MRACWSSLMHWRAASLLLPGSWMAAHLSARGSGSRSPKVSWFQQGKVLGYRKVCSYHFLASPASSIKSLLDQ